MNIMPMGDYYVWFCTWCDSMNMTSWMRMERGKVCCSACQKRFNVSSEGNLLINEASSHYDTNDSRARTHGIGMLPSMPY